jgi:Transglutaminase-like superfamily
MSRLAKFWSLTGRERNFLFEASILLLLSNICIKAIAFRYIDSFLRTHWNERRPGLNCEQEIRLVQSSISRAANILPWRSLCLSRSIAEFVMLRRRGVQVVLLAGVKFSGDSSLDAHAWVETSLAVKDQGSANSGFTTVIRIGTGAVDR